MPHPFRGGLEFDPTLEEFAKSRAGTPSTVLSGGNNSGKSLVLKYLKSTMGKSAYMIGTNRFYHVYHFSNHLKDPNQLDNFENTFQNNFWNEQYNYEQNYFDLNQVVSSLSDSQRTALFDLAGRLIGSSISLKKVDADNELSPRYIDVDGYNLGVASTGTRLLITLLGICMDDRFKTILIDEPELGLSPRIQRTLSNFLHDGEERAKVFPHLKQVLLATHSLHFLNRADFSSNYVVSKNGKRITLSRIDGIAAFHRLQFNLLGNSLDGLFFPSAIVYVEGQTDQRFIDRVLATELPDRNVVVVRAGNDGEIKKKLYALRESLGDLQKSPLRPRIFAVVDSAHSRGLKDELVAIGLLPENFVAWSKNGIEFLYPTATVAAVFGCSQSDVAGLVVDGDRVSLGEITHTKNELCDRVLRALAPDTELHEEFRRNLLDRIRAAVEEA